MLEDFSSIPDLSGNGYRERTVTRLGSDCPVSITWVYDNFDRWIWRGKEKRNSEVNSFGYSETELCHRSTGHRIYFLNLNWDPESTSPVLPVFLPEVPSFLQEPMTHCRLWSFGVTGPKVQQIVVGPETTSVLSPRGPSYLPQTKVNASHISERNPSLRSCGPRRSRWHQCPCSCDGPRTSVHPYVKKKEFVYGISGPLLLHSYGRFKSNRDMSLSP